VNRIEDFFRNGRWVPYALIIGGALLGLGLALSIWTS